MELAGLVLGGLPIALFAMDNYHRGLQAMNDYWRYGSTIKLLRCHIFVQQEQLRITLRGIGLTDPNRFRLDEFMRQKYPEKYEVFVDIISHMDGLVKKLLNNLDIDTNGKPRWTEEPPERVVWEWKRVQTGFGSSSRQKLIDELQSWNDALRVCFEKSELPLSHDAPSLTLESIQTKFNPQWCNEIRTQASQVHEAVARSWRCRCNDHQASLKLLWHEDQLLQPPGEFHVAVCSTEERGGVRWQEILFEQVKDSSTEDPQSSPQVPELNLRQGQSIKALFRPSFGKPSRGHVNIEEDLNVKPREIAHSPDADCLCSFLHKKDKHARLLLSGTGESLRIRKSLERPPQATRMTPIRTVLDAKTHQRSDAMSLSRRDRFALAAAATWAVLYLAESPWMADQWDAKPELYLLSEHHSCIWRHYPSLSSVLQTGSSKEGTSYPSLVRNKTLFALGVLLIELCLGKPFEELRQDYLRGSLSAALSAGLPADDYEIANHHMQKVYLEAGDFYGYAVQRCLRCEFPGRDIMKNFQFEQFRRDFFSHVIAPVQATFALLPSSVSSV